MKVVVARLWRIGTADATARMNRVMPIVIVIGRYPIPAAVVRFKRIMCPADTSVGARHHNILASKTKRPDLRGMRVIDSRFDRLRSRRLRGRLIRRGRLGKRILNARIALNPSHVRARSQCLGDFAAARHQNCVNDVESLMLEPAFTQPLEKRALGGLSFIPQRIVHIATLFALCRQSCRSTRGRPGQRARRKIPPADRSPYVP